MTITIDSLPDEIAEWLRAHAAERKASVEDEARLQLESAVRRQQALRLDLDRIAQIRARIGSKPLTDIEITRAKNWGSRVIVADTNLIAYLLIETEQTADAIRCRERDGHWVAPALWRHEFLNVLSTYVRAGKLNIDKAVELFDAAEERGSRRAIARSGCYTCSIS